MKNLKSYFKFAGLIFALPLVATAAASANSWYASQAESSVQDIAIQQVQNVARTSARIHTVMLDRLGAVEGRVATINLEREQHVGLSNVNVYFVKNGEIVQRGVTNEKGVFQVDELPIGSYSFVAAGANGFAAYGVEVVANDGTDKTNLMEAMAVSPSVKVVKDLLENSIPAELSEQIVANTDQPTNSEEVLGGNRVELADGTLKGRVIPIGALKSTTGTYVHILKDDKSVAEVPTNIDGSFEVADMNPGVYNFVAVGPTGFAAVSFEAVAQEDDAPSASDEAVIAAPVDDASGSLGEMVEFQDTEENTSGIPIMQDGVVSGDMGYSTDIVAGNGCGDVGMNSYDGYYGDCGCDCCGSLDVGLTSNQDFGFVDQQLGYVESPVDMGVPMDAGVSSAPVEYFADPGFGAPMGAPAGGSPIAAGPGVSVAPPTGGGLGRLASAASGGGNLQGAGILAALTVGIIGASNRNPRDPAGQSPNQ